MLVSLFAGLKRNGYTRDKALRLAQEVLQDVPDVSLIKALERIFM